MHSDLTVAGEDALARHAWAEARAQFEASLAHEESAVAWEGFARAASWLEDEGGTFKGFERAFRLFQSQQDARSSARVAMALAVASVEFRGQPAVANGWLRRAHRLLDELEPGREHGWLSLYEGHYALMLDNDTTRADRHCAQAIERGLAFGDADLEMWARSIQGVARVISGRVDEGLSQLDEAATAVLSGELIDLEAMSGILCYLMDACDRVRDYDRAAQWCGRIAEFAATHDFALLYSVCRPHYAVVLMWRGDWSAAEAQLVAAEDELLRMRPPMAVEAIVRLAELRWRQGRWEEAQTLFKRVENEPLAQLGRAEIALSTGDVRQAIDLVDSYLRRIPDDNRLERAAGLELSVRAQLQDGADAAPELRELRSIADDVGTAPLSGWASMAAGLAAKRASDNEEARRCLEDAMHSFDRAGAPFEAGRARMELARTLQAVGRTPLAAEYAQAALDAFRRLGATREAGHAIVLLRELGEATPHRTSDNNPAELSPREIEVLRLVAAGKTNQEISSELVLSLRTVERHLSNIYGKLSVEGKAARAKADGRGSQLAFVAKFLGLYNVIENSERFAMHTPAG